MIVMVGSATYVFEDGTAGEAGSVNQDIGEIREQIGMLSTGSGTAIGSGIVLTKQFVSNEFRTGDFTKVDFMIWPSNGEFNGPTQLSVEVGNPNVGTATFTNFLEFNALDGNTDVGMGSFILAEDKTDGSLGSANAVLGGIIGANINQSKVAGGNGTIRVGLGAGWIEKNWILQLKASAPGSGTARALWDVRKVKGGQS